ncbi:ABC transporter substrate binding protein [Variovorax dokdonensis]|uniref:ABC transporter substrate binding protein n=1 Tax=Variovorax dokdonensis TaxID=344883 RepID=A0ABT7NAF9_9BURK|nr:ABC transporter substrate binding protein [Variovorax dokdonensis]MDM0044914.1 ABC transporter substrate binding protein [Variovorax dokdonensis]
MNFETCGAGTMRVLVAASLLLSLLPTLAHAASVRMTVLATGSQAEGEFVQQLRDLQEPGTSFEVVRLGAGGQAEGAQSGKSQPAVALVAEPEDEQGVNAGVRTRGAPISAGTASSTGRVTVAVGPQAARSAVERQGSGPLVLAMLSRTEYEQIRSASTWPAGRRVGVLLREPPMAAQLALVGATLPDRRRLGVLAAAQSEALVHELERAAGSDWTLRVSTVADVQSIGPALHVVLKDCDAVMLLPDAIGNDPTATAAVLRAAATAGVPVFGSTDAIVRSGALAAALSSPAQMAAQTQEIGERLSTGASGATVEAARPTLVSVNSNVARSLGLRLPSEDELARRIGGAR